MSARGDIDTSVSALPGRPVPTFFSTPTQVILRAQVEPAAEALVRGDVLELRLSIRTGLDSFYLLMYSVNIERIVEERGPGILPGPLALFTSIGTVAKCFGAVSNLSI